MEGCICNEQHIPKTHEAKSDRLKGDKVDNFDVAHFYCCLLFYYSYKRNNLLMQG